MDYEGFKKEIYILGSVDLNSYKEKQMKRRINSLMRKNGFSGYREYINALKKNIQLFKQFINFITINVTEFYRNPSQWRVFEENILPSIIDRTRTPKIWSTACSTGEEPYTLAMVLNKYIPLKNIKIIATDVDASALKKAKEGTYNKKNIGSLPKDMIQKHFTVEDGTYVLKSRIKECIRFNKLDLLKDEYPSCCDLIVCRNVLIYLTERAKSCIYKKFNRSLNNQGILFVGNTEQIIMSGKYHFKSIKTFFYTKEKSLSDYN